jgi:hypothetical protein
MIKPPQGSDCLVLEFLDLLLRSASQSFQEVEVEVEFNRRFPKVGVMEEIEIVTDKKPR